MNLHDVRADLRRPLQMYRPSQLPPGSVLETDHAGVQLANGRGRTPLLHAWLKNTVTAGIWIPGARVPPNRKLLYRALRTPFRVRHISPFLTYVSIDIYASSAWARQKNEPPR
ncbi:unnamed protein product, partial [Trichogramma brassicae]